MAIRHIYTGKYFRQGLTHWQRVLVRLLQVAPFLVTASLYISSGTVPAAVNCTWYAVLGQSATLPFLFSRLIALFSYLPAQRDMKIGEYCRSSIALRKAATGSAICLGATAVATLAFVVLNPRSESPTVLLCAIKYAAPALAALAAHMLEGGAHYLGLPNRNAPPQAAHPTAR